MKIPARYRIATADLSQQIDADTINDFGIDGFTLMEVAGSSAARILTEQCPADSHGVFLCGKGNNGGDALVVARYLAQHDIRVSVVFIAETDDLSPSASKNYQLLQTIAQNDENLSIDITSSWADFDRGIKPDFIIDGMLGTGLNSDLRGAFTEAVEWVNSQSSTTYAMDIPTGIHGDTGQIMGDAVRATGTFTFGLLKQGYYLEAGKTHTGNIHFCELPFPDYISDRCSTYLIDEQWLPEQRNEPARHKYEAGVVYVIAGSEGLTGAAIMAAKSAWAEGVGAVIVVCPRGTLSVFENNLPQIIKKPVGSHEDVYFKAGHLEEVQKIVQEKEGAVLLGPGMGREPSTIEFIGEFLAQNQQNTIIDADGLYALAQQEEWEKPSSSSWILTPHPGELSQLLKGRFNSDSDRLAEVKTMARNQSLTVLSKGYPVIVGTSRGKTFLTAYDTRIFSRAGFGDVLAGKIAAFKALKNNPVASCIKALLYGKNRATASMQHNNKRLEPFDLI